MIKLVVGGVGSGKTVSMVREIIKRDVPCYSNFHMKHPKMTRLEVPHIIKEDVIGNRRNGDPILKKVVNWEFWDERREKPFDIYLDEVHNILSSRRSMSSWNVCITQWLAQIRKILGSSEKFHLYLLSQAISRIDVVARELASEIIYVQKAQDKSVMMKTPINYRGKIKMEYHPLTYIRMYPFIGENALEKFYSFLSGGHKTFNNPTTFIANPYFKYYDSYSFVEFGKGVYI